MPASYGGLGICETPYEGNFSLPVGWRRVIRQGDSRRWPRSYSRSHVSSTASIHRPLATRRVAFLDVLVAAATLGASLALLSHGVAGVSGAGEGHLDAVAVLLVACSTLPLLAWRRAPLGVFALTAAATVVLAALGYRIGLALGPAVALYLLAASRDEGSPWTPPSTVAVVGLFLVFLSATAAAQGGFPFSELLHTGLAWAVAWFAGERSRLRREHLADLEQRAARTQREAERERLLATAEERARIARDLHDSAGHAINVIAVRAGAARLRHQQDPDRSLLALAAIEEVARQTAEDVEQIVATLREDDAGDGVVEAPPGLASLDTLIAHHAEAGLTVALDTAGVARPLGAPADQAAYRILQEALTNAARHGSGGARVELGFGDAALALTVTNPVRAGDSPQSNGGHGLIGMRQRTSMLGGNLDAERAGGSFRVRARIPYEGRRA